MSGPRRILLINPTITKRRHARFPLAVLSLATALEDRYATQIIDGNVDRQFIETALASVASDFRPSRSSGAVTSRRSVPR